MMARNRIHPACTALIKAFAPGCPTMLRSWSAKLGRKGEHLTLLYDLPTDDALSHARRLVRSAPSIAHVEIGGKVVCELIATLHAEHRTLSVNALLVKA